MAWARTVVVVPDITPRPATNLGIYLPGSIRARVSSLLRTQALQLPRYLGMWLPALDQPRNVADGQGSPGDPSSTQVPMAATLGTLSVCSLPNFVAEPARARNDIQLEWPIALSL